MCLSSARASILANGSPTTNFYVYRGLRQGDHLSPFLFTLAMKGIHLSIDEIVFRSMIRVISVGPQSCCISHVLYEDVLYLL